MTLSRVQKTLGVRTMTDDDAFSLSVTLHGTSMFSPGTSQVDCTHKSSAQGLVDKVVVYRWPKESAIFIRKFLAAFPWASWISVVRSAYDNYLDFVREMCSQPAYLQPYTRS